MQDRPYRRLLVARLFVAAVGCLVACLAGCTATVQGPNAAEPAPGPAAPAAAVPVPSVRVLQLNLCNSGIAGCYTGRSTAAAAAAIRAQVPDIVTLNEVCDDDMPALERALAGAVPGGAAVSTFQPARNGRTGEPYRCRNGRQYGIGIVSRWPSVPGSAAGGGIYPVQDLDDPEERAWLCVDAAASPAVAVCTTHLAYTKREVAGAQCRYLFGTVIAGMRARDGAAPVVLGGDLNLGSGDSPDLQACLPPGSALVDDGGPQHVVGTPEFVVDAFETIDLGGTTDHPGLLVTLGPRPVG
jgi:endonuclease/exonuclease/phosphatase family metal-dependent hydrolase